MRGKICGFSLFLCLLMCNSHAESVVDLDVARQKKTFAPFVGTYSTIGDQGELLATVEIDDGYLLFNYLPPDSTFITGLRFPLKSESTEYVSRDAGSMTGLNREERSFSIQGNDLTFTRVQQVKNRAKEVETVVFTRNGDGMIYHRRREYFHKKFFGLGNEWIKDTEGHNAERNTLDQSWRFSRTSPNPLPYQALDRIARSRPERYFVLKGGGAGGYKSIQEKIEAGEYEVVFNKKPTVRRSSLSPKKVVTEVDFRKSSRTREPIASGSGKVVSFEKARGKKCGTLFAETKDEK